MVRPWRFLNISWTSELNVIFILAFWDPVSHCDPLCLSWMHLLVQPLAWLLSFPFPFSFPVFFSFSPFPFPLVLVNSQSICYANENWDNCSVIKMYTSYGIHLTGILPVAPPVCKSLTSCTSQYYTYCHIFRFINLHLPIWVIIDILKMTAT